MTEPSITTQALENATAEITKSKYATFDESMEHSYDRSSSSSVVVFPSLVINLHALSTLSDLSAKKSATAQKFSILVAILEIDGPSSVTIRKGAGRGSEVSVLKLVVSDDSASIFKLTAWRDVADNWGGNPNTSASQYTRPRRGDTVYIES